MSRCWKLLLSNERRRLRRQYSRRPMWLPQLSPQCHCPRAIAQFVNPQRYVLAPFPELHCHAASVPRWPQLHCGWVGSDVCSTCALRISLITAITAAAAIPLCILVSFFLPSSQRPSGLSPLALRLLLRPPCRQEQPKNPSYCGRARLRLRPNLSSSYHHRGLNHYHCRQPHSNCSSSFNNSSCNSFTSCTMLNWVLSMFPPCYPPPRLSVRRFPMRHKPNSSNHQIFFCPRTMAV